MTATGTEDYYPISLNSLPKTWGVARVGDIAPEIHPGFASGQHNKDAIGIPHLRPMNISREGSLDLSVTKYVVREDGPRLRRGDVLFNNTNSPELVGKTTWIDSDADLAFSNHMTAVRVRDGVFYRFAAYQLHFLFLSGYFLHRCVKHVNQASVSSSALAQTVPFAVAPLPEQRRIVAEIEKQLTRLDTAIAALHRARARLKRYRASVLKAACEGRLVSTEAELARREGRSYEPASVLLERLLKERRFQWERTELEKMRANGRQTGDGRWKTRYREPAPVDASPLPALPEGWLWASVESLSTKVVDGVHRKPSYVDEGIPFVTVKNLTAGPGISFEELNHITEQDHLEFIKRTDPEPGDLLVSKDGTLGVIRVVRTDVRFSIFVSVALVKPVDKKMSHYLGIALASPQVQVQMVPKGSGLQHIHLEDLREDCIPVPPVQERIRVEAEVERRLSMIGAAEEAVEANLRRADRLRQSILKHAFEGNLVPHDPTDEPASVLLDRIRAERAIARGDSERHKPARRQTADRKGKEVSRRART